MFPVSEDYINAIKGATQQGKLSGYIGNVYFDNDDVLAGSASLVNQCADSSDVKLGSVYIGQLNITFCNKNLLPRTTWEGKIIELYWKQRVEFVQERWEEIPIGKFIVSEANHSAEGVVVTAYDFMSKLTKRVNFSALTAGHASGYMHVISNRCGVELAQTDEEIDDLCLASEELTLYQNSDIETYQDLLYWLAQMCGAFATFDRRGRLELRQYADDPVFTFSHEERFAGCYFSDFETYWGGTSFVDLNTQTLVTYVDDQSGLVMNLGSNPFMQNKLVPYQRWMLSQIYNTIKAVKTVPFKTATLGNPAFDLGDLITFTGMSAGSSSLGRIMSFVCNFGHSCEMEGFGKNPATMGAQGKTDKNLSGLTRQSAANENVFLFLTNTESFETESIGDFESGEIFLGELMVGATKDTNVEAMTRCTYQADFTTAGTPPEFGAFRVWLRYELDGAVIKHVPFWRPLGLISDTYNEYDDTIVDYQPLLNIEGGDLKTLAVYFEYEYTGPSSTGQITIDPEGFELTVKGQGIVAEERWDGIIEALDRVPSYYIDRLYVLPLVDTVAVSLVPFFDVVLSDDIPSYETHGFENPIHGDDFKIRCSPPASNIVTENELYNFVTEDGVYNIVSD